MRDYNLVYFPMSRPIKYSTYPTRTNTLLLLAWESGTHDWICSLKSYAVTQAQYSSVQYRIGYDYVIQKEGQANSYNKGKKNSRF